MVNGVDGDGLNIGNSRRVVEQAAQSVFFTGLVRIMSLVMTGICFPLVIAIAVWGLNSYSKKDAEQAAIDKAQTDALQQLSGTLILLEYRVGQAEAKGVSLDGQVGTVNARLRALERAVPNLTPPPHN